MVLPVYNLEEYSGQVMHKNKIKYDVTQRNKAKYGICRRLDNKLKIYIKNGARKQESQEDLIQNFCVNKFGVLSLCYLCWIRQLPFFYTNIPIQCMVYLV